MRKIITAALATLALSGCADRQDDWGYEKQPWTIAEAYAPAPHTRFMAAGSIPGWCHHHDGHLSWDRLGCAVDDGDLVGYDCTVVRVSALPADHDAALFRWLNGICKGARDKWTAL